MITITRELLRTWRACCTDDEIAELVPPEGLTPLQVLEREDVPAKERLWVLLREEIIPARELRLLACLWAERKCDEDGWHDPRSRNAIAVSRRFANGEASRKELEDAWSAAWAARAAAAAYAAARAATWAAAGDARDAAEAVVISDDATQLADVRRVLEGGEV